MIPEALRQRLLDAISSQMTMRAALFETFPLPPGRVVFLGDSITEGGLWHEWFPGVPLVNRGIGGNGVDDVIARLDTAIADPAAIFLLIGTNDLDIGALADPVFLRGPRRTAHETADRMAVLVAAIRERAPQAPLFVQSLMPRQAELADMIRSLNDRYRKIADDAAATYLDLWPALADDAGQLRAEYTYDSLHLTGPGYAAWADVLRPHVAELSCTA